MMILTQCQPVSPLHLRSRWCHEPPLRQGRTYVGKTNGPKLTPLLLSLHPYLTQKGHVGLKILKWLINARSFITYQCAIIAVLENTKV